MQVLSVLGFVVGAVCVTPAEVNKQKPTLAVNVGGDRLLDGSRNFPWSNLMINFIPDLSVYHSTDKVIELVKGLQSSCASVMTYEETSDTHTQILTFTDKSQSSGPKTKLFYNFAIHGREYITSEVALALANKLCDGSDRSKGILAKTEIKMIPLANPEGRRKVESGASCSSQRKNRNDVDLNRNFNFKWDGGSSDTSAEDFHGTAAMSEPEAVMLDRVITEFGPKVFVDVHSGDTTMMHPYSHVAASCPNPENMQAMIKHVNDNVFGGKVRTGAAAMALSPPYTATGTTLDYFYEVKKIPYAFTFEVHAGPRAQATGAINLLGGSPDDAKAFSAVVPVSSLAATGGMAPQMPDSKGVAANSTNSSTISKTDKLAMLEVQGTPLTPAQLSQQDCFAYFNPTSADGVTSTADTWANSLLSMAEYAILSKI